MNENEVGYKLKRLNDEIRLLILSHSLYEHGEKEYDGRQMPGHFGQKKNRI